MKAYRITMEFSCLMSLKSCNEFLREMGILGKGEGYGGVNQVLSVSMNVMDIPDDALREKYADAILKCWNDDKESNLEMLNCHFSGFKDIKTIEIE